MKNIFFLIFVILNCSCNSIKFVNEYSFLNNPTSNSLTDNINLQNWHNLDPEIDSIPGTSVERAYDELLNGLKGKKVIVAVIDTGLDIDHLSLSNNIWINKDEKLNGKDDDKNGYIDDIYGWNYLGTSYNETRDMTRILRDNQVDDTFYKQITGSIAFDDAFSKSDTHSQFLSNLTSKYFSPMTKATQSPSTLRKAMSNAQPNGVAYAPTDARVELIAEAMRDVRFVEFGLSVNHAVIGNIVLGSVEDMGNIYQDELLGIVDTAKQMQQRYVEEHNPSIVESSDFEIEMAPIHVVSKRDAFLQKLNVNESSFPVGYYIEKTEMSSDGLGGIKSKVCDPIIINNYGDFNIFDSDIKYGATYLYNCRIVYLTAYESTAIDPDGDLPDESIFAISLIASNGVKSQVSALENIPPGPPQNLRFNYNFHDDALDLFWEEPMNPQRDVMRYQVFRRERTDQSFVLIAELDFDHSTSRVVPLEKAPSEKMIRVRGPRKFYKDADFSREKTYIYAMASIDARGLTSGYSEQIEVKFDKFKNKINRKRVSAPGAPKSYPNLYLKGDLFVDTMNSSGASRMRVFFDPEYYDVMKDNLLPMGDGKYANWPTPLRLIAEQYKLQMINLDLQNVQTLDIAIDDQTGPPLDVPLTEATIKSIF